jgi:hypothetical protein
MDNYNVQALFIQFLGVMFMKKIQFTLTVEEGKQIIAMGTCEHPLFKRSLSNSRIILKGGTTVSRIAEIIAGIPLKISGRISKRGTMASVGKTQAPHSIIIEKGKWLNVDEDIVKLSQTMGGNDLVVCGANAFDSQGRAAMITGSAGGSNPGASLSFWYSEGVPMLIPVGIEKMIPGNLDEIISRTGRRGKDLSWGMAVGLLPLKGEIITEIEAVRLLTGVECQAIGAGGLFEAQGSVTLEAWGEDIKIDNLIEIIKKIKCENIKVSGDPESLKECAPICDPCKRHLSCGYRSGCIL